MHTPVLSGLGQALRWLRDRRGRKQYQVAASAGITKGMLSAYETGRQRPSLDTLEKILDTLGCDLNDLHNAIQIVNGRPEQMRRRGEGAGSEDGPPAGPPPAASRVEAGSKSRGSSAATSHCRRRKSVPWPKCWTAFTVSSAISTRRSRRRSGALRLRHRHRRETKKPRADRRAAKFLPRLAAPAPSPPRSAAVARGRFVQGSLLPLSEQNCGEKPVDSPGEPEVLFLRTPTNNVF